MSNAPRHIRLPQLGKQGRGAEQAPLPLPADAQQGEQTQQASKATSSDKLKKELVSLGKKVAVVAVILVVALNFVISVNIVHTNDMHPAVRDGDLVITNRLVQPGYGDVVAYKASGGQHMGRVVGLPGDVVDITSDGKYTVNGTTPYETVYYTTKTAKGSSVSFPYTVKADELFLLNDLRDNGTDSRLYGGIAKSDTQGSLALLLRYRSW